MKVLHKWIVDGVAVRIVEKRKGLFLQARDGTVRFQYPITPEECERCVNEALAISQA